MPYLFNQYHPLRNILFFIGEGVLLFLSMTIANLLFKGGAEFIDGWLLYASQSLLFTVVFQLSIYFFDLYELKRYHGMAETLTRLAQAYGIGCIILAVIYYFAPLVMISTRVFWSGYLVTAIVLIVYRFYYYRVLLQRLFAEEVVIIGTGDLANDIAREVEGRHDSAYKVIAFVGSDPPEFNPHRAPVFGSFELAHSVLSEKKIERIIVAPDDRRGSTPVRFLLQYKMQGVAIEQGVSFYERMTGKILVERVDPSWIIFSDGFVLGRFKYLVKRLLDISLAGVLFVFTLPLMLVSAVVIKLESHGPVLYRQERVGQDGRLFKVIKFRSMRQDAEKNGAVWAKEKDDRVTRFGSFIRKVRIDELPQLWNVLKGEMSMVGPRPERPVFVEELVKDIPYYNIRHGVKPGVTGWAQVRYPYGASKEDALRKLEFDLYYIKNISLALDLVVIFHTVKTVLFGRGGR